MHKIKSIALALSVIVLLGFITVAPLSVTGCKSTTAQKATSNTLTTLGQGVNAGYSAFTDQLNANTVSTNGFPAVAAAFNAFQVEFGKAITLVANNTNAVMPQAVITASVNFSNAVIAAKLLH